jgi:hypothetical protein
MEMLAEIGIKPDVTCLPTKPADIQWMVQCGSGVALIDRKTPLDPSLATRPIATFAGAIRYPGSLNKLEWRGSIDLIV